MSHVEVKTTAVQQKTTVTRRFLVVAVMQIDRAGFGLAEQVILDLCRPKLGIHVRLVFAQKTTVLGFDSNDSIHSNQITHRMATWLSEKMSLALPHRQAQPRTRWQAHRLRGLGLAAEAVALRPDSNAPNDEST